ncbi:MAG: Spy/CpxP family protein refolding chaperone [Burkholderiales bacterium]
MAVFIAGAAAAWGAREYTDRDGRGEGWGRRKGGRGPDAVVSYLARKLDLTPAQRDSVRAIIARHRPETEALWAEMRPRFDAIKARMWAEIDAQLSAEQRVRRQRLVERAEHHRRRGEGGAPK